jgi:hypothetical protein
MTATMPPGDWLGFLEREYLNGFIGDGGASVKFAVPFDDVSRRCVLEGLVQRATDLNYLVLRADAAETRVHMVDQLFNRLAAQVPWRELSLYFLGELATREHYKVPTPGVEPFADRVAVANELGADFVGPELRRALQTSVFRDTSLAKDFRVAMTQLCRAELFGGTDGDATYQVITDWLTGRNKAVGAVKPYQIRSRINRTNARYLLESMFVWIRLGGYRGSVVLLDTDRVTVARNPKDDRIYYTRAAMLDVYEVLRQFIDGTDRLQGCLIVVVPGREFVETDKSQRGMGNYEALMLRVIDEIRDRDRVNPMASLVRLQEVAR